MPRHATSLPLLMLLAVSAYGLGVSPWLAVLGFLVLYNAGHLWLRIWAFRTGWRAGLDVGRRLAGTSLDRWAEAFGPVNMVLGGAAVVFVGRQVPGLGPNAPWVAAVAVVMGLLAYRWPTRFGRAAVGVLLVTPVVWYLIRG